ncbi:Acidic endochitinase [Spatholobus suberectus]|nr:Acidic endochitinase [Spatholobus suberectus]
MAFPKQASITFLLLALVTLPSSNAADCDGAGGGAISVYWGQRSQASEGTLQTLCSTGKYNIVILETLLVYDDGRTPVLNLADHCGTPEYPCSRLQPQIEYCQQNKIKVFLSIGSVTTLTARNRHSMSNPTSAEHLAKYLLENFLSGQHGPLGSVSLDGIDIISVPDGNNIKWPELVKAINASTTARKIYLSAAPQCVYPDHFLGTAINTGLFDYLWVLFFYQNPCIYSNGNPSNLLSAWDTWTSSVPNSSIFLGLVASNEIAGYIPPEALISEVLPVAKQASNYGGVMIWNRYFDIKNDYSDQIKDNVQKAKVCRCVCNDAFASNGFSGLSMPLSN